jgi:hypothetical protein
VVLRSNELSKNHPFKIQKIYSMANEEKKPAKEAAKTFHNIMKASVSGSKRKLYFVTFDKDGNPIDAKIASPMSNGGHGLWHWDAKANLPKSVYVEAENKEDAMDKAKEMATRKIERGAE